MRCNGGDLVMTISRGSAENKQLSAPAATWLPPGQVTCHGGAGCRDTDVIRRCVGQPSHQLGWSARNLVTIVTSCRSQPGQSGQPSPAQPGRQDTAQNTVSSIPSYLCKPVNTHRALIRCIQLTLNVSCFAVYNRRFIDPKLKVFMFFGPSFFASYLPNGLRPTFYGRVPKLQSSLVLLLL